MTEHSLRISRSELLKQKGRVSASLFHADSLPQQYLEKLEDRLCEVITSKVDKETLDETIN